jgi:cytidylate kinase
MIIAIDGPAASGKGTLAKRIAVHFRLAHLDTGLLYRAVARDVRKAGGALDDTAAASAAAMALDPDSVNDPGLRDPGLGEAASVVARIPQVRAAMLASQRAFARRPGGAVLDGRDIGTVVCPDADVKLYVTASAEVRAERRYREKLSRGEAATLQAVLEDILRRDARDSGREASPMRPADDAFLLDTSNLDI